MFTRMNTIQRLELAERVAAQHNRWHEFSRLYCDHRNKHRVLDSVERTLRVMGLWEEYCKQLSSQD